MFYLEKNIASIPGVQGGIKEGSIIISPFYAESGKWSILYPAQAEQEVKGTLSKHLRTWAEEAHAAANPKYCYEWSFEGPDGSLIAFCVWYANLQMNDGIVQCEFNLRRVAETLKGVQKRRAINADFAMQKAC